MTIDITPGVGAKPAPVPPTTIPDADLESQTGSRGEPTADGEPTILGPSLQAHPDHVTAQEGDTVAARMRAAREKLQNRIKEIAVPPDDVWAGDLVLTVKPIKVKDRQSVTSIVSEATVSLKYRDGENWTTIENAWLGVAELMGITVTADTTVGDVIVAVCSTREIVAVLAENIIMFSVGKQSVIEQALGE